MVTVTQQFEFSAAHRLHSPQLSPAENQAVFGKCNRLHGHGHNYVLEVSVSGPVDAESGQLEGLPEVAATVKRLVVDRFDHRNLNLEVEEFRQLNPTVENMVTTIWNILEAQLDGVRLSRVRLYETPKTWAEREARF
jgi:6-pyruvoyltetrahydropterin/6-carboxytetrahydropterin synthase